MVHVAKAAARALAKDAPAECETLQPKSSRGGKGSTTFSRTSMVFSSDAFWTVLDSLGLELRTPAALSLSVRRRPAYKD